MSICTFISTAQQVDINNHLAYTLSELKNPNSNHVFVIAHRGDWRNAPENSIQSIKNCIEMGVDIVEVDISETKDGKLILMHDFTLDRTTTGSGNVKDYTLEELKKLNLRYEIGVSRDTDYKIPTLKETLNFAKGKIMLDLDVKAEVDFNKISKLLHETNTINQVILRSYRSYPDAKKYYGKDLKKLIYFPCISNETQNIEHYISEFETHLNPIAYTIKFKEDDMPIVKYISEIINNKDRVWMFAITADRSGHHHDNRAVNDIEGAYGWLINKGVKMIQTDRPQLLIKYLRSKNLHQ